MSRKQRYKDEERQGSRQREKESLKMNENKEEQSSMQKLVQIVKKIFIGQAIQPQINRSLVSNTYYALLEIVHVVVLFAVFNKSNSSTYSVMQSSIGGFFFLVYLIPRISRKHTIFQITFIMYAVGTVAAGLFFILLFSYFHVFSFYCTQIQLYYEKKNITQYTSKSLCRNVYYIYIAEIIVQTFILLLRILYLFWCFRAYMMARENFQEQEKKRRRKDRYNELLLKRNMYNQKRRV